jgi:hypothetical protein
MVDFSTFLLPGIGIMHLLISGKLCNSIPACNLLFPTRIGTTDLSHWLVKLTSTETILGEKTDMERVNL